MTQRSPASAYVLARIHARHGLRAGDADWARLAAHRDYHGYLKAVAGTPLAPFVANLPADADIHGVERHMRAVWSVYVADIAQWHGPDVRGALRRLIDLPALPARGYLARGEAQPGWLTAPETGDLDAASGDGSALTVWRTGVLRALPDRTVRQVAKEMLDELIAVGDGGVPHAGPLRAKAQRLFRRSRHPMGRVLAHLACVASDLLELRGELCVRLALGDVGAREGAS
ncbi:hypothetical protein RGUI_2842 [Rhodovulum sp. P5]|uniref:hypothetical protein n=1 Tax=Rhodovulum sp. P5 TaxID=1564506 RepID=UPI0009C300BE|nr:hypothetical protein [Rhodovulum sp. P5]ARE40983.1 hypothetical protein RGUI_2842 [Rhodovulum sp. P5]